MADDPNGFTARYLMPDLPENIGEDEITNYFSVIGDLEEVTVKAHGEGKRMGSVKFNAPTNELRQMMLGETHVIEGSEVCVMTWKMQKLQKPGYQAKKAAEVAAKRQERPPNGLKGHLGKGGGSWDDGSWDGGGKSAYGPKGGCGPVCGSKSGPSGVSKGYGPVWGSKSGPSGVSKGGPSWDQGHWDQGHDYAYQKGMMYAKGAASGKAYLEDTQWTSKGGCGWGKGADAWWGSPSGGGGGAVAAAAGGKGKWGKSPEDMEVTARFLLSELPEGVTEESLREYFGAIGDLEIVEVKTIGQDDNQRLVGSVKFAAPTSEVRNMMLRQTHQVMGQKIKVETHKMKKLARPGFQAAAAAGTAAAPSTQRRPAGGSWGAGTAAAPSAQKRPAGGSWGAGGSAAGEFAPPAKLLRPTMRPSAGRPTQRPSSW